MPSREHDREVICRSVLVFIGVNPLPDSLNIPKHTRELVCIQFIQQIDNLSLDLFDVDHSFSPPFSADAGAGVACING